MTEETRLLPALMAGLLFSLGSCASSPEASETPDRSTDARDIWNGVFEQARERGTEWEANTFLADVVAGRTPGRALDIGMGQGRNSLFLAEQGWDVTGFDISDEAVNQARQAAANAGLTLNAEVGDVNLYEYGSGHWDLVVSMYMHGLILPRVDEIMESIAPGGILVIEGFHSDLGVESVQGGYFGYTTNQLLTAFDDLRILYYEDRMDDADWGKSMEGEKPIVRFVATKPAAEE